MPHRDLFAGLVGGTQIGLHDLTAAAEPEQQESAVVLNEPPARPTDVCARRLRRVDTPKTVTGTGAAQFGDNLLSTFQG